MAGGFGQKVCSCLRMSAAKKLFQPKLGRLLRLLRIGERDGQVINT
jgi:hypothetical protein